MYDRWDSRKGCYVRYDYQPLGDRYSRGLSETPRGARLVQHPETGRIYLRRTRTTEVYSYTAKRLLKLRRGRGRDEEDKEALEGKVLYLELRPLTLLRVTVPWPVVKDEPPGKPIRLTLTRQHKGERVWLLCPYCERRIGKLYAYQEPILGLWQWGCQKCLGLSYPSQHQHKSRERDLSIMRGEVKAGLIAQDEALERELRRLCRFDVRRERMWERLERLHETLEAFEEP